jgi:hypothetical protein
LKPNKASFDSLSLSVADFKGRLLAGTRDDGDLARDAWRIVPAVSRIRS